MKFAVDISSAYGKKLITIRSCYQVRDDLIYISTCISGAVYHICGCQNNAYSTIHAV